MNRVLPVHSFGEAIETNLFSYFPFFSKLPGVDHHEDPAIMWSVTDIAYPLFNSILGARIQAPEVDTVIEGIIARGRSKKVPLLWWIGPDSQPADLAEALMRHGFAHEADVPGMAADLFALDETLPMPPGLVITQVRDADSLNTWCRTAAAGFELPAFAAQAWHDWYVRIGLSPQVPLYHYIGWQHGRPVASATLWSSGGAAGIYNVATVANARRQGIASIMTLELLRCARSIGCRVGVLHASAMGVGVYQRLGFKEYCRIGHYLWSPE